MYKIVEIEHLSALEITEELINILYIYLKRRTTCQANVVKQHKLIICAITACGNSALLLAVGFTTPYRSLNTKFVCPRLHIPQQVPIFQRQKSPKDIGR